MRDVGIAVVHLKRDAPSRLRNLNVQAMTELRGLHAVDVPDAHRLAGADRLFTDGRGVGLAGLAAATPDGPLDAVDAEVEQFVRLLAAGVEAGPRRHEPGRGRRNVGGQLVVLVAVGDAGEALDGMSRDSAVLPLHEDVEKRDGHAIPLSCTRETNTDLDVVPAFWGPDGLVA